MKFKWFLLVGLFFCFTTTHATNVKDYGAKGNGVQDDTDAIIRALKSVEDGYLEFPKGRYRITRTIEILLSESGPLGITGGLGSATVIMEGKGPAFRIRGSHQGSALPASVSSQVWDNERMFTMQQIEILGMHPEADGLELSGLMQPVIRECLIRKVRHGILLTHRNRNVILEGNHIYDCTGVGVFLDQVNIHQMIISHSHISYCQEAGIKVLGGEIRNFQITGNDIEYNCLPEKSNSADLYIDLSEGGSVREGTISGNTIQAIESSNGANIRFTGDPKQPHKLGLWSITGNHISNQYIGIWLEHARGISISGNTFVRAYYKHFVVKNSQNVTFGGNVIDHNPDYFPPNVKAIGGILIEGSERLLLHDNIIEGVAGGVEDAAIQLRSSRNVSVTNCHIRPLQANGIIVNDCQGLSIVGNTIEIIDKMVVAMSIKGDCSASLIRGNRHPNSKIVNRAKGVQIRK